MNTFGVVFKNVVLRRYRGSLYRRAFLMARAADERNIQRSYRGQLILDRHDIVVAVTVHAMRGQRVAVRSRFAVQGLGIQVLLLRVAGSAVDLGGRGMRKVLALKIGMAAGAANAAVDRGRKFFAVDEERNHLPACLAVMLLSPWHARQVSFCSAAVTAQAGAEQNSTAKARINPGSTARRHNAGRTG